MSNNYKQLFTVFNRYYHAEISGTQYYSCFHCLLCYASILGLQIMERSDAAQLKFIFYGIRKEAVFTKLRI